MARRDVELHSCRHAGESSTNFLSISISWRASLAAASLTRGSLPVMPEKQKPHTQMPKESGRFGKEHIDEFNASVSSTTVPILPEEPWALLRQASACRGISSSYIEQAQLQTHGHAFHFWL